MPRRFATRKHAHAPRKAGFRLARPFTVGLFAFLVTAFGVGYLAQINMASSKGLEIRTLEREIADLKEEGERLELKVAQERSVQAVETKVKELGMVPTPKLEYVMATVPQVARK